MIIPENLVVVLPGDLIELPGGELAMIISRGPTIGRISVLCSSGRIRMFPVWHILPERLIKRVDVTV